MTIDATFWVAVSFFIFFGLLIYLKVPQKINVSLTEKISEINEAVKAALKCNKPAVIDVDVDPKALYSFRRDSFKHRAK